MAREASLSSNKVKKCRGEVTGLSTGGKDRISDLPDAILSDILSHFPTIEAVSTSVLSKRWRYLWTSVPCVEIEAHHDVFNECFIDYVDRVLHLNDVSCLQKLYFSCSGNYGNARFSQWISAMISRDVEELLIDCPADLEEEHIELPPCLFTCKKLVILELSSSVVLNVPVSVSLCSLKILRLYLGQFYDENSMKNLLAGCPVLEELSMERGIYGNLNKLHIQSSSLKRLTLDSANSRNKKLRIVLDARNLEQLDLKNHCITQFHFNSLSSVVSARLDLYGPEGEMGALLRKMNNTKYLNLSYRTMKSLKRSSYDSLPMFHCLTHLVVEMVLGCPVLTYLLDSSPNLINFDCRQTQKVMTPDVGFRAPKCLMLHLESVNFNGFNWFPEAMDMVRYFLKNDTVLKKMSIYTDTLRPKDSNLCKELFMLAQSLTACEFEIFSYDYSARKYFPLSQSYQD